MRRAETLLGGGSISRQDMWAIALDDHMVHAGPAIAVLDQAYTDFGAVISLTPAEHTAIVAALAALDDWGTTGGGDFYRSAVDNTGTLLYALWSANEAVRASVGGKLARPDLLPTAFTQAEAEAVLPALAAMWGPYDALSSEQQEWGVWHVLERPTGSATSVSFPASGASGVLRSARGDLPPIVGTPDPQKIVLPPPITAGQGSMLIAELGNSAANSTIEFLKAVDHTTDWNHDYFSVEHSETWAAADPDDLNWAPLPLPTTLAEAISMASSTTSLSFTPAP